MELSILIPVYNEKIFLRNCLESLLENTWDFTNTEIIIIDGGSDDGTLATVNDLILKHPFVKVQNNPRRFQVHGLNSALDSICSEYVIRCDAHAIYPQDYISSLIFALKENSNIGNVGRPVKTITHGANSQQIAMESAMGSKVGVGLSHRSLASTQVYDVDTVLFGAWRRLIFDEVGYFDPNFIRGQDYEHNLRIRKAGYRVVQVPGDPIIYYTRPSLKKGMNKIFQYSAAKVQVIKKHSTLPNLRSLIPVLFYSLIGAISFIDYKLSIALFVIYAMFLFVYGIYDKKNIFSSLLFMLSVIAIHVSHAFGFLYGVYKFFILNKDTLEFTGTR